ncbi:uncharacterized protein METZ01_LOCUS422971 [marine metagenome]|uniref:Uncharacterized protein n=1 Tax=marine metagenome TaxID=408172 RepID=A0A382XG19_9ZZZZ
MERFEHLAMVAFLILGLAMVRLMVNVTSLMAKNTIHNKKEEVRFYWPHSVFCFITFFTIILFWWTSYPLNNLTYFPDEGCNLFTYLLFLSVPFLFFMICEIVAPQEHTGQLLDLREYYYKYHRVILGLAWTLQVCLIGNLFVFFQGELFSLKVLGRLIMLSVMAPMVISNNKRVHEIGMGIFFVGFIYTIIKYHIFVQI